jgi:hypothetical protein
VRCVSPLSFPLPILDDRESGVSSVQSVINLGRPRRRDQVVAFRQDDVIGAESANKGS